MKLHIGAEIRRVMEEKGIQPGWLAQQINTSQRNFYDILTREAIGTDQLLEISAALEYDFFALYSRTENLVAEPSIEYKKKEKDKVQVIVELDGMQTSLDQWIKRLTVINTALNQSI